MAFTDILPQLIINGLIAGSIYALAASGFSLVYHVIKFLHFAQGATITISAYAFFFFMDILGLNFVLGMLMAIIASIFVTWLMNVLLYKPLRKRKATNVISLIASLSLLIFFVSLILAIFGSSTKTLSVSRNNFTIDTGFFTITFIQIIVIASAIISFFVMWFILKKTKLGKAMRALSDNKDVSQVVGIDPEKIYNYTFIISGIMGGIAGVLIGLEQNLFPRMGVLVIVKGFISAVVGGITSVPGSILGGFLIGLVENLGIWFLPSGYKDAISFTILLAFLLFRPQGLLGVKMRDV
jgi:branched-chain amino acid transport system permease protein